MRSRNGFKDELAQIASSETKNSNRNWPSKTPLRKIMRRILRKVPKGVLTAWEDDSTLARSKVWKKIIEGPKIKSKLSEKSENF